MPLQVRRAAAKIMSYCIRQDGDCANCSAWNVFANECNQDDDLGCTGHGDESYSDADSGL